MTRFRWILVVTTVAVAFAALRQPATTQTLDVIIRNGRVLDGSGNLFFYEDIGIRGDEIVGVGDLGGQSANRVIDARGHYVTSGFIGLHEHIDRGILGGDNRVTNYTTQGFTTGVIDADGGTRVWPLRAQRDSLEKLGHTLNLVPMVGHGAVRAMVMGTEPEEVMRYATEEEVQELAKVVAPYGGHFQAHMRNQGRYSKWLLPSHMDHPTQRHVSWLDAATEVINVSKVAGIPVMFDHIHPKGPREWGISKATTQLIDRAWEEGHQVYVNMHSYEGYSAFVTLVPRWALIRGEVPGQSASDDLPPVDYIWMLDNLGERLQNPELREMIRIDAEYEIIRQGGAENLIVVDYTDPSLVGKSLAEVAQSCGESIFDTVIWLQMNGLDQPGGVLWMAKAVGMVDIKEWMRQDYTAVSLDRGVDTGDRTSRSTHPGEYGTSGLLLREFVFERGTITLPHAIRSMPGLPAQILGSQIAVGHKADLVVFDPETVRSTATYLDPYVYQVGMTWVLVNGRFVVDDGVPTMELPGVVLERQRGSQRIQPRTPRLFGG